jgi:hypothetical protein
MNSCRVVLAPRVCVNSVVVAHYFALHWYLLGEDIGPDCGVRAETISHESRDKNGKSVEAPDARED